MQQQGGVAGAACDCASQRCSSTKPLQQLGRSCGVRSDYAQLTAQQATCHTAADHRCLWWCTVCWHRCPSMPPPPSTSVAPRAPSPTCPTRQARCTSGSCRCVPMCVVGWRHQGNGNGWGVLGATASTLEFGANTQHTPGKIRSTRRHQGRHAARMRDGCCGPSINCS